MRKSKTLAVALALVLVFLFARLVYGVLLSERNGADAPAVPMESVEAEEADAPTVPVESVEAEESADIENEGAAAPDFAMLNADGETVRLSDFQGTPVVLNFWATWCPPCRQELPHFDEAFAEYGDRVKFLMVDLTDGQEETVEGVQAFMAEQGYVFPVCYDTEREGAYAYGVNAIPTTYFINADGTVHSYQIGALTRELLYDSLVKLLE